MSGLFLHCIIKNDNNMRKTCFKNFLQSAFLFGSMFCTIVMQAQTVDATATFDEAILGDTLLYASVKVTDISGNGETDVVLALSESEISTWADYSAAIVFKGDEIYVRDGGVWATPVNSVAVEFDIRYEIWVAIDAANESYTTWVKTEDMPKPVLIYENAGFRKTAITSITRWSALHNPDGEVDELVVDVAKIIPENYTISLPGGVDGNLSNVAIPAINIASLPVTIELWYKPEATQNNYSTVWYNRGAANNSGLQYDRWTDQTKIKGVWNGASELPNIKPVADRWNHVAMVVTSTSKTIYINGEFFTETGSSFENYAFDGITYLGWDNAVADRTFTGEIDELRIWSDAKTAEQLEDNKYITLVGDESNLIGYWNFNDLSTTATDITGNGFDGVINGGAYLPSFDVSDDDEDDIPALYDNCPDVANTDQDDLDNDGIGDLCDDDMDGDGVPNDIDNCPTTANADQTDVDNDGIGDICDPEIPEGLNFAISLPGGTGSASNVDLSGLGLTTLPYTLEMWIKPIGNQIDNGGVFYHRGVGDAGIQYSSSWQGSGKLRIMSNISGDYGTLSGEISADEWHHLAVVVTATSRTIIVDGVVNTQSIASSAYDFSAGNLYLGWDNAVENRAFKGMIDDVRVWNVERSELEISTTRFVPLNGDETGLIGYYNFDDRADGVASDSSTTAFNGVINGGTYAYSSIFDPMEYVSSATSQKSAFIKTNSTDNVIACIEVVAANQLNALNMSQINLSTSGTSSLSDISNIKVYYSGADSIFNTAGLVAELGTTPETESVVLSSDFDLTKGVNYLWITYDISADAAKGNVVNAVCTGITLAGETPTSYTPDVNSSGDIIINNDVFINSEKFEFDVVTSKGYTTSNGANFVSFQQNAIMTYNGYQYVIYWNSAKHVCIARKKMPLGAWEEVEFTDYTSPHDLGDNHYNISFGICANDGTIHMAFDHHNDPLHYRVSVVDLANKTDEVPWSSASFGAVQNYLEVGVPIKDRNVNLTDLTDPFDQGVTYPRFISKPNGDLLFECRSGWSGDGNSHLWDYNGTWSYTGEYMHGRTGTSPGYTSKCGYINGLHYTPGGTRLHASLVWREEFNASSNHEVYYAYSDDDGVTWFNAEGVQIANIASSDPLHYDDSGFKVYSVGQNRGLINQESQAVDSKGGIHILQSYMLDSEPNNSAWPSSRYDAWLRHIYQDESGTWQNDSIASIYIDRSEIAVDQYDNLYVVTPGYRVYYASAADKWATWTEFDISENGTATAEGLIDREALLKEHVLSFVFAHKNHSTSNGQIIVPYYLLEHPTVGNGNGMYVTIFGDTQFESIYSQTTDSINLTSASTDFTGDSVSVRCEGVVETQFAEVYDVHVTTSNDLKIWLDDELVMETGPVTSTTEFNGQLELRPSHKYEVRIEAKYATDNIVMKVEWASESQERQITPKSALYAKFLDIETGLFNNVSYNLGVQCYPNPSENSFNVKVDGVFNYEILDIKGQLLEGGIASDTGIVGETLQPGIYILKVTINNKSELVKLVKL